MRKLFAGLDVSPEKTAICVVDQTGASLLEVEAATDPAAIAAVLKPYRRSLSKVAHEAGGESAWLQKQLLRRRFQAVCLDARRTRAALSAQRNKTDRNDARDLAILLARGFNGVVHVKSDEAHRLRLVLRCRTTVIRKARDLRRLLSGSVKPFGAKLERSGNNLVVKFPRRGGDAFVSDFCRTMIECHDSLVEYEKQFDTLVTKLARKDPVCRRLMTAPGVGPIAALTFRAAVDDPTRFTSSRLVGAYFGLTPRRRQSGQSDFRGHISRMGDGTVRSALYSAAAVLLVHSKHMSALKAWGLQLWAKKGFNLACTACARKLAIILHRMWITETDFQYEENQP